MMLLKLVCVLWTLPNTLLGVLLGVCSLPLGGGCQFLHGALEFHGGLVAWLLKRLPNNIQAMTLGHSIIGRDPDALQVVRVHEHVHIRQYEKWGPFFIPVYLLLSFFMLMRGRNPYFDNPFEVEAYACSARLHHSTGCVPKEN